MVPEKRKGTLVEAKYEKWGAYADSKLAMSIHARAFSKEENNSVQAVSLHPGIIRTELQR